MIEIALLKMLFDEGIITEAEYNKTADILYKKLAKS